MLPHNINSKLVVTIHDIIPLYSFIHEFDNVREKCRQELIYIRDRKDTLVISDSEYTKKELISKIDFPEERIFVVPLGFETCNFGEEFYCTKVNGIMREDKYIAYLGAIESRKGVLTLLDAFNLIAEKFDNIKLVLAGSVNANFAETFKVYMDVYKYRDRVILPGFVSDEDRNKILSNAEVFVLPSFAEGFGIPILEAMQFGTPVIASRTTSLPEVGGDAALYFEPGNEKQLADCLIEILRNDNLKKNLSTFGIRRCKEFSWKKTAKMTEQVYREFLK